MIRFRRGFLAAVGLFGAVVAFGQVANQAPAGGADGP